MSEDRGWFWNEGYRDGMAGKPFIVPDETRHQWQRGEYADGYEAGDEERGALTEAEINEQLELESLAATVIDEEL